MKIFLSWSGDKSRQVAEALHEWLPNVIQGLEPWISVNDIEKGAAWRNEVARQLDAAAVGIICLTRENLERPWLLFEAGAISKKLDDAFVCTYLLNLEPVEVKDPLAQFQSTKATEADTRKLLHTINRAQKESALPQERVDKAFEKWWIDLDQRLQSIPNIEQTEESKRPPEDILSEILVTVRSLAQHIQSRPVTLPELDDLHSNPIPDHVRDEVLDKVLRNWKDVRATLNVSTQKLRGREAVLEIPIDKFTTLRHIVRIDGKNRISQIDLGSGKGKMEYIGQKVKIVQKNYEGERPLVHLVPNTGNS